MFIHNDMWKRGNLNDVVFHPVLPRFLLHNLYEVFKKKFNEIMLNIGIIYTDFWSVYFCGNS